jgi:DNA-binding XRE family transcriptional regulator
MNLRLRNRLNRVLHERGLAEGEVALVARLDQGHLNRIKNGRVKPTLVTALRIANALGVPVHQLFYLETAAADLPTRPAISSNPASGPRAPSADADPAKRGRGQLAAFAPGTKSVRQPN